MACSTCCPMARYLSLGVLAVGLVAIGSGLAISSQRTASELPAPTAAVTPFSQQVAPTQSEDLNPTITTRDWQMVDTPKRGKR